MLPVEMHMPFKLHAGVLDRLFCGAGHAVRCEDCLLFRPELQPSLPWLDCTATRYTCPGTVLMMTDEAL